MSNDSKNEAHLLSKILLSQLSVAIEKMTTDEIASVLKGDSHIDIRMRPTKKRSGVKRQRQMGEDAADSIINELKALDSAELAMPILTKVCSNRDRTEFVARRLDLPVHRADTVNRLRERIIDAVIGYRKRSDAIRNPK